MASMGERKIQHIPEIIHEVNVLSEQQIPVFIIYPLFQTLLFELERSKKER